MIQTKKINYQHGDTSLVGYYAYDDVSKAQRPVVLVCPDWSGRNEFADKKAELLATLGYVGFAVDMYGNGATGNNKEENIELMTPLMNDRSVLRDRVIAAFDAVKALNYVDTSKIGGIGFCFGGLCILDLARSGADVKGVVSFHGLLNAPQNFDNSSIKSKVLALHGYDDPMVTTEQVIAFQQEMTNSKVDWQFHTYGNTKHAFTNPNANDDAFGTVYNRHAEKRAMLAMKDFFLEVFE